MRYLVHFQPKGNGTKPDGKFRYSLPYEFRPAQEASLLEKLDELESGGFEYHIEVCYTIDKSEIIAPS